LNFHPQADSLNLDDFHKGFCRDLQKGNHQLLVVFTNIMMENQAGS